MLPSWLAGPAPCHVHHDWPGDWPNSCIMAARWSAGSCATSSPKLGILKFRSNSVRATITLASEGAATCAATCPNFCHKQHRSRAVACSVKRVIGSHAEGRTGWL